MPNLFQRFQDPLMTPFAGASPLSSDEILRQYQNLHPAVKEAALNAGKSIPSPAVEHPPTTSTPAPAGQGAAPPAPGANMGFGQPTAPMRPIGGPKIPQGLGMPTPESEEHLGEFNRLTAPPLGRNDPLAHTKADTGLPGSQQIHNPVGRTLATIADAIGSGFFPRVASVIPGTTAHHNMLVNQAAGTVKEDTAQRSAQARQDLEEAQAGAIPMRTDLESAQAEEARAKAHNLLNPPANIKEEQLVKDADGALVGYRDENGVYHDKNDPLLPPGVKAVLEAGKPRTPKVAEGEMPLGERVSQLNQALLGRYQVLNPREKVLPASLTLPANATQKDFDRIDKLMEATERATGTREQQAQTNEMRRQTIALAAAGQQHRQEHEVQQGVYKAFAPALDSAERFNVMTKNYEDAIRNHDQQAMLSLLANHLGMTMGLQKGSRLTRDIIREAEQSRPWLQGLAAKFDSNGYLTGVTLTPSQMQQMVHLGRERFSEDTAKARNEARYLGATDDGPNRTPNKATMHFYMSQSGGDVNKAKQFAAADGWSVQ